MEISGELAGDFGDNLPFPDGFLTRFNPYQKRGNDQHLKLLLHTWAYTRIYNCAQVTLSQHIFIGLPSETYFKCVLQEFYCNSRRCEGRPRGAGFTTLRVGAIRGPNLLRAIIFMFNVNNFSL